METGWLEKPCISCTFKKTIGTYETMNHQHYLLVQPQCCITSENYDFTYMSLIGKSLT